MPALEGSNKVFIFRILRVLVDLILINAGYLLTFLLRYGFSVPMYNFEAYLLSWPWLTLSALGLLYLYRLYGGYQWRWAETFAGILCVVSFQALVAVVIAFYIRGFSFPRTVLLLAPFVQMILLSVWRRVACYIEKKLMSLMMVLVAGHREEAFAFAEKLKTASAGMIQVEGLVLDCVSESESPLVELEDEHLLRAYAETAAVRGERVRTSELKLVRNLSESPPVLGDISTFCECLDAFHPDGVFVCTGLPLQMKAEVLYACTARDVHAYLAPDLYEVLVAQSRLEQVDDIPVFTVGRLSIPEEARLFKRVVDIFFSFPGFLLSAPFMLLIALAIKIDSKGPVFYRQRRLTEHGRPFNLFKFRTMVENAEKGTGPVLSRADDPRITRVGRILRAARLDELPQLINVLRGDMSLVGPRPERPYFVDQLMRDVPEYVYRMNVKSGITGLAQVAGRYSTSPECKLMYDLLYTRSYSPARDVAILLQTLKVILMKDRAS